MEFSQDFLNRLVKETIGGPAPAQPTASVAPRSFIENMASSQLPRTNVGLAQAGGDVNSLNKMVYDSLGQHTTRDGWYVSSNLPTDQWRKGLDDGLFSSDSFDPSMDNSPYKNVGAWRRDYAQGHYDGIPDTQKLRIFQGFKPGDNVYGGNLGVGAIPVINGTTQAYNNDYRSWLSASDPEGGDKPEWDWTTNPQTKAAVERISKKFGLPENGPLTFSQVIPGWVDNVQDKRFMAWDPDLGLVAIDQATRKPAEKTSWMDYIPQVGGSMMIGMGLGAAGGALSGGTAAGAAAADSIPYLGGEMFGNTASAVAAGEPFALSGAGSLMSGAGIGGLGDYVGNYLDKFTNLDFNNPLIKKAVNNGLNTVIQDKPKRPQRPGYGLRRQ